MTHEYTLLIGGTILTGPGHPPVTSMAWAGGTVIALGTEAEMRGISRGDSAVLQLGGAFVVPIDQAGVVSWPPASALEIGGPADLAILDDDPRDAHGPLAPVALIRGGHVTEGNLPSSPGPRGPATAAAQESAPGGTGRHQARRRVGP